MHTILGYLYAAMLYAYPREFRLEFGREMRQVFETRLRRTPGSRAAAVYAMRVTGDALWTAAREHASRVWTEGRRKPSRGPLAEWAATIVIYLFATTTLVQAYVVPTGSMEGNIRIGDHLLVDRTAYASPGPGPLKLLPYREVERGDIIVFRSPEDPALTLVKRVIGVPGDRIRLADKQVVRNGQRLIEPYTQSIDGYVEPYRDNFPNAAPSSNVSPHGLEMLGKHREGAEIVVPEGALFVLGDNRDNSLDSRYWGFVPRENVLGKPLFVYWSYDASTQALTGWSLDHLWDVARHFFDKTRWDRTLLVPRREEAEVEGVVEP